MAGQTQQKPPTYEQATGSASFTHRERNGITPEIRRSIEDESRPLPAGWVRSFDPQHKHQYFVNTKVDPPRAIWHHPYDDDEYMSSLSSEERARIGGTLRVPSREDLTAETTDEEGGDVGLDGKSKQQGPTPSGAATSSAHVRGPRRLGRTMKDKLTGTTHEQRATERRQREEQERNYFRQHQVFRRGLEAAIETGQPQLLGEDDNGTPVYLEPPGFSYPGVKRVVKLSSYVREVYYDPEPAGGPKGVRHLRPDEIYGGYPGGFGRPGGVYNRPYGPGYGGGMGYMPLAAPLFGGMLLGGLMF